MIPAADYRAKAADCARRADEAQDDYHRKNFQALAIMWTEMADKAEGRAAFTAPVVERDEVEQALATIRDAEKRL